MAKKVSKELVELVNDLKSKIEDPNDLEVVLSSLRLVVQPKIRNSVGKVVDSTNDGDCEYCIYARDTEELVHLMSDYNLLNAEEFTGLQDGICYDITAEVNAYHELLEELGL